MKGMQMRSHKPEPAILFLILTSVMVTLLLVACGDATATTGPAAQPTATVQAPATPSPIPNQQITPAPNQLPTRTSQPNTTAGSTPAPEQAEIVTGQPFQLKVNQSGRTSDTGAIIKFTGVSEDSRCPASDGIKTIACAWAGQVSARLEVKQGNNPTETVILTLPGATSLKTIPASATKNFGNNQLQLLKVEPHPIVDQKLNPLDHVATLQITPVPAQTAPASPTAKPTTNPPTTSAIPTTSGTTTQANPSPNMDATSVPIIQGESFQLRMNQTAFLPANDLYVSFLSISEDSRCPEANPSTGKSVACFWSGQITADIKVTMNNGQTSQTVKLTLPGSVNTKTTSKATVGNLQLEVKQILPRAIIDVNIQPGEYVVTLVVTKV